LQQRSCSRTGLCYRAELKASSIEMALLNLKGCILVNYLKELIRVHSLY